MTVEFIRSKISGLFFFNTSQLFYNRFTTGRAEQHLLPMLRGLLFLTDVTKSWRLGAVQSRRMMSFSSGVTTSPLG